MVSSRRYLITFQHRGNNLKGFKELYLKANLAVTVVYAPYSLHSGLNNACLGIQPRAGLYILIVDGTVKSHSGHPTRGCIPRAWAATAVGSVQRFKILGLGAKDVKGRE